MLFGPTPRLTREPLLLLAPSPLNQRVDQLRSLSRWSRWPLYLGLIGISASLLMMGGPASGLIATGFVASSLTVGVGVIGQLWAHFEQSGLRQRVYLFWCDPSLNSELKT